jgi:hypothetical protein
MQKSSPLNKCSFAIYYVKQHTRIRFGECAGIFVRFSMKQNFAFDGGSHALKFLWSTSVSISAHDHLSILEFLEPRISSLFHGPPPRRPEGKTRLFASNLLCPFSRCESLGNSRVIHVWFTIASDTEYGICTPPTHAALTISSRLVEVNHGTYFISDSIWGISLPKPFRKNQCSSELSHLLQFCPIPSSQYLWDDLHRSDYPTFSRTFWIMRKDLERSGPKMCSNLRKGLTIDEGINGKSLNGHWRELHRIHDPADAR